MRTRNRRIGSIKNELLKKSREAALSAVQIFNNPQITFKAESYVVLMVIGWTYLFHAYYKSLKIDYRYKKEGKNKFSRTKYGAFRHWSLEDCINYCKSPIDENTANNLKFLIGLRHEIEHQMTTRIDESVSAKFQACCLNYDEYIKKLFDNKHGIGKHLSFSLQFSAISTGQKDSLKEYSALPKNIAGYVQSFEANLSEEEFLNQRYAYRVIFVQKTANHKSQADSVIDFVRHDDPRAIGLNKAYAIIKETDKKKYLPKQIRELMKSKGYKDFTIHKHTQLWQSLDAKSPNKNYGVSVAGTQWYWYENWLAVVEKHCQENEINTSAK